MKSVYELKDIFAGQDVYLLGSGASLRYIDKSFFDDKNTVCVNDVAFHYLPTAKVSVTKYHFTAIELAEKFPDMKIVASSGHQGAPGAGALPEGYDNIYQFLHNPNRGEATAVRSSFPKEDGYLLASWSTITSAMHFCAYAGAKNIIIAGLDSGSIDGESWVEGYPTGAVEDEKTKKENIKRNMDFEQQSIIAKEVIKELYGCNIHSLNPFINFNLEGHKYRGANSIN